MSIYYYISIYISSLSLHVLPSFFTNTFLLIFSYSYYSFLFFYIFYIFYISFILCISFPNIYSPSSSYLLNIKLFNYYINFYCFTSSIFIHYLTLYIFLTNSTLYYYYYYYYYAIPYSLFHSYITLNILLLIISMYYYVSINYSYTLIDSYISILLSSDNLYNILLIYFKFLVNL